MQRSAFVIFARSYLEIVIVNRNRQFFVKVITSERGIKCLRVFVRDNKLGQAHLKTLSYYGFYDILLLKIIYVLAFASVDALRVIIPANCCS